MSEWLVPVVIIVALILLNGLFVAAEFAIIGVSRAAIDHLAEQGHSVARVVRRILRQPRRQDQYLATAQLGITVASLGLGMYGEHVLAEWLVGMLGALGTWGTVVIHGVASVLAVALLTYFHIVIGEMVPKAMALQRAEDTVLRVTPFMLWMQRAFFPLVWALNGLGNGLLRVLGINRQEVAHQHYHTPEELAYIVRESQEGGLLRTESGNVLQELFEFGDLTAGEVMVPRVNIAGIPVDAEPKQVLDILRTFQHARYPVYEGDLDHIIGVVHSKDLLRCLVDGQQVCAVAAHPVPFIPATLPLDAVVKAIRLARARMVVVMDEHGGTAGLISVEDLFEEVTGEVDEEPVSSKGTGDDASGRLLAAGTLRLEEVGDVLNISLEHEEVDTVSGLVLSLLERPPRAGDAVEYGGLRFEVTAVVGRGVKQCAVSRIPQPPDPGS